MDNASRGLEAREIPEKHLETMLVGKDLRTQLDELVVAYGEESLKLNPDEAFMSNLASRMNEVGEKLKAFEGSSESAIHNYNKEAKSGADEARLNDLAEEVDRHEQLDTLGQAEAVARYGAVAVAHGENAPVLEHLGQNIDNMTVSGSEDGAGSGSSSSETDELAPVLSPDAKEPTSIRDDSASSVEGKSDTAPADADEKELTTEPTVDVEPTPAPESEPDATDAESAPAPTDEAEPVVEPDPETPSPVVDNPEGNLVDDGDVVLEGPVLYPVSPESPDGGDDVEGVEDEPAIVEGEVVDDRDDDNPESSSEPESGPEPKPLPEIEPGPGARLELGPSEDLSGESTDDVEAPVDEVKIDPVPVEGNGEDSPERSVEFTDNPFRLATAEAKQPYERDQDVTLRDDKNGLYGVFDGMGSADESRKVAEKAANILEERAGEIEDSHDVAVVKKWIEDCLGQAHNELIKELTDPYPDIIPGSTASVVKMIYDNEGKRRAVWGSVGDSRIYRISASGKIERITKDEGGIDDDLEGNIVTNMVGIPGYSFKQSGDFLLEPGDRILVMSDGITGDEERDLLSDQEIADAVNGKTAEDAAQRLIEISRKHDDKSAVIVDVLSEDGEPISRSDVIADEPEIGTTPLSDRVIHRVGGLAELRPDPGSKPALEELREVAERTGQVVSSLRQVGGKMFGKYYEKAREAIGAKPPIEDIDEAGPVTKKTIPRPVRPTNTPRAKRKEGLEPSGAESDSLRPDLSRSPLGYEAEVLAGKVADGLYRAKSWVGVGDKLSQPENGPIAQDSEIVETPVEEVIEVADSKPEEPLTVSEKALKELREAEKRLADFNEMAEKGPKNDPEVTRAEVEMRRVLENHLSQAQRRYGQTRYLYGGDIEDGLDIPGWVNGGGVTERDEAIVEERRRSDRYSPSPVQDADSAYATLPDDVGAIEFDARTTRE